MTKKHHSPSKPERFIAIFGAALGFSLLFMFALSSFVNMIHHRDSQTNTSTHVASNTPPKTHTTPASTPPKKDMPAEAVSLGALFANANAEKGAKVAKKCVACHGFDKGGKNKVGPNLYGIIGKGIAITKGFKYSKAMTNYATKTTNWKYDNLVTYLRKPKKVVPKTKMAFAGIRKNSDLANLIAYLRAQADTPVPLPTE